MLNPMIEYGVGQTPLHEIAAINGNRILFKLEQNNFLGSIKARTAYALVNALDVSEDMPVIESTSGNLGVALDFFCKEAKRHFICLLDETIIAAKLAFLQERGVAYIMVPTEAGCDGRSSRMRYAQKLMNDGTHFWVNQYDNENGVSIHRETTGVEILEQTKHEVTCIVSAVGSGGTIAGVGECLKKHGHPIHVIAVEPFGSTIFSTCDAPYLTAGAGLKGKPGNIVRHADMIDESFVIHDSVSIAKCKELSRRFDLQVGITTGMAYAAAEQFCQHNTGEVIVIISPDGAEFYSEYL